MQCLAEFEWKLEKEPEGASFQDRGPNCMKVTKRTMVITVAEVEVQAHTPGSPAAPYQPVQIHQVLTKPCKVVHFHPTHRHRNGGNERLVDVPKVTGGRWDSYPVIWIPSPYCDHLLSCLAQSQPLCLELRPVR